MFSLPMKMMYVKNNIKYMCIAKKRCYLTLQKIKLFLLQYMNRK